MSAQLSVVQNDNPYIVQIRYSRILLDSIAEAVKQQPKNLELLDMYIEFLKVAIKQKETA